MSFTVETKSNETRGQERKLMSDFIRKRIEALSIPSYRSSSSSRIITACDSCPPGRRVIGSTKSQNRDTDGSDDEAMYNCEPIHKGCPICIACFAGFNPQLSQEQVTMLIVLFNVLSCINLTSSKSFSDLHIIYLFP